MMAPDKEQKQREEIKDLIIEKMDIRGITPNFTEFVKVQPDYQRWIPHGPTKKPQQISDPESKTLDNSYVC